MAAITEDKDELIRQLVQRLRETVDENDRLKALVTNLTEGANAHQTLQSLYRNAELPESLRAKCAIGALPHETPRLEPVPPPLELVAEPVIPPLAQLVEERRARMNKWLALTLAEREAMITGVGGDAGDGDDTAGS